jgi:hypothetical protein
MFLAACAPAVRGSPTGLALEEHVLRSEPSVEPLAFEPVEGSMDQILAVHAAQRAKRGAEASVLIDGQPGIRTRLGTEELIAREHFDPGDASDWVGVTRGGQETYRIDTGMPSPIAGLRGLWTYDQHWVLETAFIEPEAYSGRLSMDGALVIPDGARLEAFDFQLLHGRPFYFFRTVNGIRLSYDGADVAATYDEVPHYWCCSAAALNPIHAEDMLAFFARRAETWYYVEAGTFKS